MRCRPSSALASSPQYRCGQLLFAMPILAVLAAPTTLGAAAATGGFRPAVSAYDVTWNDTAYAGAEFGTASMPVGNGDAAANVWYHDGALYVLLAKGDAWSQWHDLLKVGRLRLSLHPPPSESGYSLTMHVASASMELRMAGLTAKIWMDSTVNALRVEMTSKQLTTLSVELQRWRNESRPWTDAEQGYNFYCDWSNRTTMPPDVVVAPTRAGESELLWFHRNIESSWKADVTHQGLGHALELSRDPFINLTFGALVVGMSGGGVGQRLVSSGDHGAAHRLSSPARTTRHTVSAFLLTQQTDTVDEWIANARALAEAGACATPAAWAAAWKAQEDSWTAFWNMSRLDIKPSGPTPSPGRPSVRAGQGVSWSPARASDPLQLWNWEGMHAHGQIRAGPTNGSSLCLSSKPPNDKAALSGTEHAVSVVVCDATDATQRWAFFPSNSTILALGTPHTGCDGGVPGQGCCLSVAGGSPSPGAAGDLYGCACSSADCPDWPSNPDKNQQFKIVPGAIINAIAGFHLTAGGSATPTSSDDGRELARRWHLQRMIHGMLGKGRFPIKFNGNLFTVGKAENIWGAPDFRDYGGFYWHQNTRQTYWSMLGSGDYDLMAPFFEFYTRSLPLLKERTKAYWGHGGVVFPETLSIFGLFPSSEVGYGCDRRFGAEWPAGSGGYKPQWYIKCAYLRYHYNNVLEVTEAMLAYYRHTGNSTFAEETLLPFAHEAATFFYSHYQDWHGTLVISPAQSLETWQEAINPSEQIAGVRSILAGLIALPETLAPPNGTERAMWTELLQVLPQLPMGADSCKAGPDASDEPATEVSATTAKVDPPYLAHAEYWSRHSNIENPELYAIFPF